MESPLSADRLADLAWQANTDIDRRLYLRARSYLVERVRPALMPIVETHRDHLLQILDDLVHQISFFS